MPLACVDESQICSALVEVINNAATATAPAAEIHISAIAEAGSSAVLLAVRDNGPGMDEATAGMAFTPFFSSQRAGRRQGLGLPRAKRNVENNGGKMWLNTRPTGGTTVYIQLPAADAGHKGTDDENE